jgi:hypothetical protein
MVSNGGSVLSVLTNVMVHRVYYWQVTYFEIFIMGDRYLCGIVLIFFVYFVKCFTGGCVNLSEVFSMGANSTSQTL